MSNCHQLTSQNIADAPDTPRPHHPSPEAASPLACADTAFLCLCTLYSACPPVNTVNVCWGSVRVTCGGDRPLLLLPSASLWERSAFSSICPWVGTGRAWFGPSWVAPLEDSRAAEHVCAFLLGMWTGPVFIFGGGTILGVKSAAWSGGGGAHLPAHSVFSLVGAWQRLMGFVLPGGHGVSQAPLPLLLAVCVPPPVKCVLLFPSRLPPMDGPLHAGPFRAEVCILAAHSLWVSKLCHQGEAGHADTSPEPVSVESGGVCRRRAWGRRGVQRRWCR